MPRTSYGNEKLEQSWLLVSTLLDLRGTSPAKRVSLHGADITYENWDNVRERTAHPSLTVKASLVSLSKLSKNALNVEQIRESINEHLGNKFLGILEDQRTKKSGRGAEIWKFSIQLWSSEPSLNCEKFSALWAKKKRDSSQPANPNESTDDSVDFSAEIEEGNGKIFLSTLTNFLQPYEKVISRLISLIDTEMKSFSIENDSDSTIKKKILTAISDIAQSECSILFESNERGHWKKVLSDDTETSTFHTTVVESSILTILNKERLFSRDSHGHIIQSKGKNYIIIPLKKQASRTSFVCLCDVENDRNIFGEPFGEILSTVLSVDLKAIASSSVLESYILDGLKRSFNFVSPQLYKRRFDLFKERLEKMTVNFQPIVKLSPLVLEAWEALARDPASMIANDPSTMTAPVDLFDAAELWGIEFTTELDLYFLRKATKKYRELRNIAKLKRFHEILPLSVNVYPSSIIRTVYLEAVKEITSNNTLPAGKLILEISEKSSLPETPYWNDELMTWKSFKKRLKTFVRESPGIRFAIDDFGVGHASVSRLVGLNLEYVKIDREVLDYAEDVRDKVITFVLETLIEAGNYSPHIIVEGVDADYPISLNALLNIGAQSIQGYIVDRAGAQIYERLDDEKFKKLQEQLS